ncbi:hypothetical protein H2203_002140 [Taxawa tesnikishii (nom. ined.)]|nr:hypothetical protein H2203_002140 [Dothideales sp. JES 119]
MTFLSAVSDYKAYHILSYGTLLGATFFQSFMGGVIAFKVLPRPMFSRLQQATFPIFFAMQTILPLVMIATYPGEKLLGVGGAYIRENTGFGGFMAEKNRWSVMLPIATMVVTAAANMLFIGPATTKAMKDRHHQETRDGKKSYDPPPHSKEMQRLNKLFSQLHGVSSLTNLAGFGAMIYYGFVLADRL